MEEDEEIEEIRRKKLIQQQKLLEAKRAEEELKALLRVALEPAAYERLSNVRLANHQLYLEAAQYVIAAYKRFGRPLTEQQLLNTLYTLKSGHQDEATRISFKRK
jgi:DNA-binding TFAR19-related protein (PDSD5 family)